MLPIEVSVTQSITAESEPKPGTIKDKTGMNKPHDWLILAS